MPSGPKRIIFTGGSGKAGRHLIPQLQASGHQILNLDLQPFHAGPPPPGSSSTTSRVHTIRTDLTDAGQVFSAFSAHFAPTEPLPASHPAVPDAVVHFAGYATPLQAPDTETLRVNVLGVHHVLEAACKLGIRKVVVASSVTSYGVTFAQGRKDWPAFPVEEGDAKSPTDVYALSKVCAEELCRGYAGRYAGVVDVYVLRIGRVVAPQEYREELWRSYVEEPERWDTHGWAYTDVRDLGGMLEAALERDGLGYRVWNAVNDTVTNYEEVGAFLARVAPAVERREGMSGRRAPLSNRSIKEDLGWREKWDWVHLVDPSWAREQRVAMLEREGIPRQAGED